MIVDADSQFFEGGHIGHKLFGSSNMVVPHFTKGTDSSLLAFLSLASFAAILAVLPGLALPGRAGDFYANSKSDAMSRNSASEMTADVGIGERSRD